MEGVTEIDRVLFTIVLLALAFIVAILIAAGVERAYERERRNLRPRPRIPRRERDLLGDDWREVVGRRDS